jgi:hypothetical protein
VIGGSNTFVCSLKLLLRVYAFVSKYPIHPQINIIALALNQIFKF